VIEEKLTKFRDELQTAKNLINNRYADRDYYKEMISHLEKMIKFYERLKLWKEYI